MTRSLIAAAAILAATAVAAHENVANPVVKDRMDLMKEIGAATKTISQMAKGQVDFDAAMAEETRQALEDLSRRIPAAFEAPETDPESEAAPKIWDEWESFAEKAAALTAAAEQADMSTRDTTRASFNEIGKACGACHMSYKTD